MEKFENFGASTFTFKLHEDYKALNLTTHESDPPKVIDLAKNALESILMEGLREVATMVKDQRSIVHIYMSCEGLDRDFMFNRSGPEKMTLRNLLKSRRNIEEVVHEFSRIIQSGKPVILDPGCTLRFCVYEPPDGWVGSDDEPEYADDEDYYYLRTIHNNTILCL